MGTILFEYWGQSRHGHDETAAVCTSPPFTPAGIQGRNQNNQVDRDSSDYDISPDKIVWKNSQKIYRKGVARP